MLAITLVTVTVAALCAPGRHGDADGWPEMPDLHTYRAAGAAWAAGDDPYDWGDLQEHSDGRVGGHFVYPAWTLPFAKATAMPPPDLARRGTFLASCAAVWVVAVTTWWRLRRRGDILAAAAACLALVSMWPSITAATRQGNAAVVQAALVALAFAALDRGKAATAGVSLAFGGGFKLFALPLALTWLQRGLAGRRALAWLTAALALLAALHLALAPSAVGFLEPLRANVLPGPWDQSTRAWIGAVGLPPAPALALVDLALLGALVLRARRGPIPEHLAWLTLLLLLPRLLSYEGVLAVPPLAAVASSGWVGTATVALAAANTLLGDAYPLLTALSLAWVVEVVTTLWTPHHADSTGPMSGPVP